MSALAWITGVEDHPVLAACAAFYAVVAAGFWFAAANAPADPDEANGGRDDAHA